MDVDRLRERRLPQLLDAIKATAAFPARTSPIRSSRTSFRCSMRLIPKPRRSARSTPWRSRRTAAPPGYNFDRRGWRRSFEETSRPQERAGRNRGAGRRRRRGARGGLRLDGSGRRGARRPRPRREPRQRAVQPISPSISARRAAASRAISSARSRRPMASSTRRRSACAAFPAIRCRSPRSRRRIGPPMSSIRRSTRNSSRPLGKGRARAQRRTACACTRRSRRSGFSLGSTPDVARLHRAFAAGYDAREAALREAADAQTGGQNNENIDRHGLPERRSEREAGSDRGGRIPRRRDLRKRPALL